MLYHEAALYLKACKYNLLKYAQAIKYLDYSNSSLVMQIP